jgi:hypothetical protein
MPHNAIQAIELSKTRRPRGYGAPSAGWSNGAAAALLDLGDIPDPE